MINRVHYDNLSRNIFNTNLYEFVFQKSDTVKNNYWAFGFHCQNTVIWGPSLNQFNTPQSFLL